MGSDYFQYTEPHRKADLKIAGLPFIRDAFPPNVQTESKNLPEDIGSDGVVEEFFKESLSKYGKEDERRLDVPAFIRKKLKEL